MLYCIVRKAVHFLQTASSAFAAVRHLLKGLEKTKTTTKHIKQDVEIEYRGKPIFCPMDNKMIFFNLTGVLEKVLVYASSF